MSPAFAAFALGLFGEVHCAAMCGSAASMLCSGGGTASSARWKLWAFNGGRLFGYAVLGALASSINVVGPEDGPLAFLRFILRTIAVVAVLSLGLQLLGLPSPLRRFEQLGASLWRPVSGMIRRFVPLRRPAHALAVGAAWGLMPCGLLYAALAMAATTESPAQGALTMLAFGLGTGPVMVAIGQLTRVVAGLRVRPWARRAAGLCVLAFGVWTLVPLVEEARASQVNEARSCCHPR